MVLRNKRQAITTTSYDLKDNSDVVVGASTHEPSRIRKQKVMKPRAYADAVCKHAQVSIHESLFPGSHYADLAFLLHQQYQKAAPRFNLTNPSTPCRSGETKEFAAQLNLQKNSPPQLRFLESVHDFESTPSNDGSPAEDENLADEQGTLLFLRGYARPEWLNAVGAKYSMDPEFLRRHLHDCFKSARSNRFMLPALPSEMSNMLTLRITTIGRRLGDYRCGKTSTEDSLHTLRINAASAMRKHLEALSRGSETGINLGDSMVRKFTVHDSEYFSWEQDISIYVKKAGAGWIAIVWTDVGNDLYENPIGPWRTAPFCPTTGEITYLPVVQHMHGVALRSPKIKFSSVPSTCKMPQTAALLHLDYGQELDPPTMASDPFYALHDIFRFVLYSERHLINMVKDKIENELDYTSLIQREHQNLSNVLYNKQILTRHVHHLRQTRDFIKARGKLDWPRPETAAMQAIADAASEVLLNDVTNIIDLAQSLITACDAGMTVMMNNAQINEAQSTLRQVESSGKLTKLAFFYVPLSFTTSLFGMNVADFGVGASLRIWQWITLSVPLLVVSLAFMLWDWQTTLNVVQSIPLPRLTPRRSYRVEDIEMPADDMV